jgi:hypothetical protein
MNSPQQENLSTESDELIKSNDVYAIFGNVHLLQTLKKSGKIKNVKRGYYSKKEILEVKAELDYRKSLKKPEWPKK